MEQFVNQDPRSYFFVFRFENLISGPKNYRNFRETDPRSSYRVFPVLRGHAFR